MTFWTRASRARRWLFALCAVLFVVPALALTLSPPISTITINGHTYTNSDWEANFQGTLSALAADIVAVTAGAGINGVSTNAQLKALTAGSYSFMTRYGFYAAGDGGGWRYIWSSSACPITGGNDGTEVAPNAGTGCWIAEPSPAGTLDARMFGVLCDGSANDSPTGQKALDAQTKGGDIVFPATGHVCRLAAGLNVPDGVYPTGVGGFYWQGPTGTLAQWTAKGTWFKCEDLVNSCFKYQSVGSGAKHFNVIYAQPDPAPGWTPIQYPPTFDISGAANFNTFEDIAITAASHCINMQGPTSGVAGVNTVFRDIYFNGCWNEGVRMEKIDNTVRFYNPKFNLWWNVGNTDVQAYMKAHRDGFIMKYVAGAEIYGAEFFLMHRVLVAENNTVMSGFGSVTFATALLQFSGVSLNEVCKGIDLPGGNGTVTSGLMTNVLVWGDTITGCPAANPVMFDLPSDNANWTLSTVNTGFIQTLASIGAGAGGILRISDLDVSGYSAFGGGAPLIKASQNCSLSLNASPLRSLRPFDSGTAGPVLGPGVSGQCYVEPIIVGTLGGTEGAVMLKSSQNNTTSGSIEFLDPHGNRTGFVGRSDIGASLNVVSDVAEVQSFANGGASLFIGTVGGKSRVSTGLTPMNTSCSGLAPGDWWKDVSADNTVKVCP